MNLRNAAALINDDVTTIQCSYTKDVINGRTYTFKCTRTLADQLHLGDYVIADSAKGFGVLIVHEVHQQSQIDPEAEYEYKWVFQKMDKPCLDALQAQEDKLVDMLTHQRRENLKQQVLAKLGAEGVQQLLKQNETGEE